MSNIRLKFMMDLQRIEEEHYQLREGELVQCQESDVALQLDVLAAILRMLHNGIHIFCEE